MKTLGAALAALLLVTAAALPVAAEGSPSIPGATCAVYGHDRICSAQVPSFDGTPLDVDVTLPAETYHAHPLIVMLHGFGNNKHEWESTDDRADNADKWHWNSHWFASHGYYVLTYTARGFHDPGKDAGSPWQPNTPGGDSATGPNGTIKLKSKFWEIRDTQYLAGLLAAIAPDLDRDRVAVTGGSYGGGESWLQATEPVWQVPGDPDHPLKLQVAVAKYPWTDLGYSLAPNGHGPDPYASSLGAPAAADPAAQPLGVEKLSYVAGFFALGNTQGRFDPQATAWNTDITGTGDPYEIAPRVERPLVADARYGLTQDRSAYYQREQWAAQARSGHEVAVYSVSGWTDDLFPVVESFREYKYLKALDPLWPVQVEAADIGHPRAQNQPATWHRINQRAWEFLTSQIQGSHRARTEVISQATVCHPATDSGTPTREIRASTPEGLATGTLTVLYPGAYALSSAVADPNGPITDPVLGSQLNPARAGCRESTLPAPYTAVSAPLTTSQLYAGLGGVQVRYLLAGSPSAGLEARIWDLGPDGRALLVTRGARRIDTLGWDPLSGTLRLPMFGNQWTFEAGHRVRLDLTLNDSATFRPTPGGGLAFGSVQLELPVRDGGGTYPGAVVNGTPTPVPGLQ